MPCQMLGSAVARWMAGTLTQGLSFVVSVFQENRCALFCIRLALVSDVTLVDEKADVAVTAVGFTRAQLDNCTNFSFSPKFYL